MVKIKDIEDKTYINPDMNDLFESIEDFAEQLTAADFLIGSKLENISIPVAGKTYAHGLNGKYTGFFVLNRNSTAIIYTEASADDTRFILLKASAATTATIWVF